MEILIPHNYTPREYQRELLASQRRNKIAVWHRRGGKSKAVLNQQIKRTQLKYSKKFHLWLPDTDPRLSEEDKNRQNVFYYFLPTYKQAKAVIWDTLIREHLPKEIVEKINETELAVYYRNGSIQRFVGCEDIDKHRGINPIDVVFDEYSEMKEDIWTTVVQPVLRENEGTATFIFTPKGKNHSWKLVQMHRDNPDWFISVRNVLQTNALRPEEIEEAKRSMPQAMFEQEFMCEFLESASQVFKRVRANLWSGELTPVSGRLYKSGLDLAKYNDWTVLTPVDRHDFRVGKQERFNQIDYNLQKAKIEAFVRRFNNSPMTMDSTGVGEPIYDDLSNRGIPIEPYKFTEVSRRDLLMNLALMLEQDKLKLPNDEVLLNELESFRYELTERGKTVIKVPDGVHDDCVMSLALAVWNIGNPIPVQANDDFSLYDATFD